MERFRVHLLNTGSLLRGDLVPSFAKQGMLRLDDSVPFSPR